MYERLEIQLALPVNSIHARYHDDNAKIDVV